ncbi:MAG: acyltransferase, partial [Patescibacteria group bacterium]
PHKTESLADFYKKRFSRILVPILVWSLFYIVWGYFHEDVKQDFTFSYVIEKLASGKPYYHLWFMYMLMGLYFFTPVFRAIVARLKTSELVFFIALTFGIEAIQAYYEAMYVGESNLFLTWFLTYVPFYFTGYLVRYTELPLSTGKLALVVLAFGVLEPTLACLGALYLPDQAGYFYKNLNLMNILFSVSLMFLFRRMTRPLLGEKITPVLAPLTFGIYLMHMVPLAYLHRLDNTMWAAVSPYLYTPLFSLIVLVVTAIVAYGFSRTPVLKRTL